MKQRCGKRAAAAAASGPVGSGGGVFWHRYPSVDVVVTDALTVRMPPLVGFSGTARPQVRTVYRFKTRRTLSDLGFMR